MDDCPSTQSFSSLHHHHHRPSFPLTLPSFQSLDAGYSSCQLTQDSLEQVGSRGDEPGGLFLTSNTSSVGRRVSSGGDRVFLNTSTSSMDRSYLDEDSKLGRHFDDSWYGGGKKEVWEDGESCESTADDFHSKGDCYGNTNDVFYTINCASEEGVRRRVKANYNNYTQEAKSETVYNRDANGYHFTKQTSSYSRSGTGSLNDGSVDYCRTDSRLTDSYLGREEDYGSSCGSGEDQLQAAEAEGPWLSVSPSSQGEGRWKGAEDNHTLALGCLPQRSVINRTYTQKLDSFSEAFLSQRKKRFPVISSGDSFGQIWEFGAGRGETPGLVKSRQSCAFDSDSYLPAPSSSSSPAHPSLPSFPSPPTSSHLMSSVLSPPPTPLPPPSQSPSKMDSPGTYPGTGYPASQGGEPQGALQFFTSRLQSVPSVSSSGMIWKFPLLSHCFPQSSSGDLGNTECNLRSSYSDDYSSITGTHDILQSPESSFLTSSSHHPSRALCPSSNQSLHASLHLTSHQPHLSDQHLEAMEKIPPFTGTQKVKNGRASLKQLNVQQQAAPIYTGMPFPSILHSSRGQRRGRYTPRPLLNPLRRGTGLYASISSHKENAWGEEEEECSVLPYVNVGPDFQADLPPCFEDGEWSEAWSSRQESPQEQLLWKPWDELEERADLQDRVEKLLSMCSSSCLPGGGSNTELALHCLHHCQGNTMATLELLLFSQPSPRGDYHYSGCDFWTDSEKSLFSAALGANGKDFSLIEKMVKTKTVQQCVEFYYLSKKLQDKQNKQKEEESRDGELEQEKSATPICQPVDRQFVLEEAVPVPSLASFFPCKLCGKMFYKIKSRNAHMKIHRQPQEDWTERRLQHQLITQRLALGHPTNLMPTPGTNLLPAQVPALTFSSSGLAGTSSSNTDNVHNSVSISKLITPSRASVLDPSTALSYSNIAPSNSHPIANIDGGDINQREPTSVLPFHQSWGSFGHQTDPVTFFCSSEEKEDVGAGTLEGKEVINWQ